MKIGIVIAVEEEFKSFLESSYEIEEIQFKKYNLHKTTVNGNEVYAIKSGFGIIDATAATTLLINCFDVELIINFGVTGALDPSLKVSELFVVNKCLHYDYDVSHIDNLRKFQYEEFKDEFIPLDQGMIEYALSIDPTLRIAADSSGDRFVYEREDKIKRFMAGCNICDMEIAGIARTCYLNDVKCLSIKCISDEFDHDGSDYIKNVKASSDKAFKLIDKILNNIK